MIMVVGWHQNPITVHSDPHSAYVLCMTLTIGLNEIIFIPVGAGLRLMSAAARSMARRGHGCLYLANIFSETGRSPVQRSPAEFLCVLECNQVQQ
jgi:hypothetical protein